MWLNFIQNFMFNINVYNKKAYFMFKYKVMSLDVWADEKEGWDINNKLSSGYITTHSDDAELILEMLVAENHLSNSNTYKVDMLDDFTTYIDSQDGMPILEFQLVSG